MVRAPRLFPAACPNGEIQKVKVLEFTMGDVQPSSKAGFKAGIGENVS